MKKYIFILFRLLLLIVPFTLGIIGYLEYYPGEYTDALYFSIRLFSLNYDIEQSNFILELARWIAPLFLLTWIIIIIKSSYNRLYNFLKLKLTDPIVIYGNNEQTSVLSENLKTKDISYIVCDDIKQAKTHIILFDDDYINMTFLFNNIDTFTKNNSTVYIQLNQQYDMLFDNIDIDIFPFSNASATAQLFWINQNISICKHVYTSLKPLNIVIIGSGIYAKNILEQGLLFNIYCLDQNINYHLFGNWQEYQHLHLSWKNIALATNSSSNDTIKFYDNPWYQHLSLFRDADEIIVCNDTVNENLYISNNIYQMIPIINKIKVLNFNTISIDNNSPIEIFGQYNTTYTYDIIIQKQLIENAKAQHSEYSKNNPNALPWYKLPYFLKLSNISSSNFNCFNIIEISKYITEDIEQILARLEHMRWARFHYLYNWTQGERNNNKRIHNNLVEFDKLSIIDKNKDIQANKTS